MINPTHGTLRYTLIDGSHLVMHRLILSLECKDILRALCPCFLIMRIDMRQDMGDSLFKVLDCVLVGVKVARAIPLSVKVGLSRQGIVAMNRDKELDPMLVRIEHHIVQVVQNSVIPGSRRVPLEGGIGGEACAFLGAVFSYMSVSMEFNKCGYGYSPSSQTRNTLTPAS